MLIQTIWRLATMQPLYHLGWWSLIVHLGTLTTFACLCALAWDVGRERRWVRGAIATFAALLWVLLTLFDINCIAYARIGMEPLSLGHISAFFCAGKSVLVCLAGYPSIILLVIAPAALLVSILATLIYLSLGQIADNAGQAVRAIGRVVPSFVRGSTKPVLAVICGVYLLAWVIAPSFMLPREPASSVAYIPPFEHGPIELINLDRPNYRVVQSANVDRRPLILITVDSLRSDMVGLAPGKPTLTPFLRSLAASGKLHDFGPAVAACSSSYCGIPAIQSSASWAILQDGPPLGLADVLSANGFQTHFLLSGLHASTANLRDIYGPNIATFLSDNSPDSSMRLDDREQVRRLAGLKLANSDRAFIAIHLMSAHAAGLRFEIKRDPGEEFTTHSSMLPRYRPYYEAGVRQADRIIGDIFATLRAKGLLDRAIVIVVGDHGERFGIPGKQTHGGDIDRWTAAIPLLMYDGTGGSWPSQPLVSQADAAATLIGAVGIARPASWQGQNLKLPMTRRAVPTDSRYVAGMVALIDGRRLLFTCWVKTGETKVEAFDGSALSGSERARALEAAPRLYAGLARRKDGGKCFSGT